MAMDTWTDERVRQLKALQAAGMMSASEIGNEIGVTRNAVIGKLQRMGLTLKANPGPRAQKSRTSVPSIAATARPIMRPLAEPEPPPIDAEPDTSDIPEASEEWFAKAELKLPGCSIMELTGETCRWPLTDGAPWRFCGCEPIPGVPYCPAHTRKAYAPHSRS